jgi:RNAse (barnase) inhibitor barstar
MPPFDRSSFGQHDWRLFLNSPTVMYHDLDVLSRHASQLEEQGYRVLVFDCATWQDEAAMHNALSNALTFPEYYGSNLDALDECLATFVIDPFQIGVILALLHFDSLIGNVGFRDSTPRVLLELIQSSSRRHLLLGERLMALVHLQNSDVTIRLRNTGYLALNYEEAMHR